jgi:hypothetical protein
VRLFEHAQFEQAMVRAADHLNLSEQFVEKDYYVTEILRIVNQQLGHRVIKQCNLLFSGGEYPSFAEMLARFQVIRDLL